MILSRTLPSLVSPAPAPLQHRICLQPRRLWKLKRRMVRMVECRRRPHRPPVVVVVLACRSKTCSTKVTMSLLFFSFPLTFPHPLTFDTSNTYTKNNRSIFHPSLRHPLYNSHFLLFREHLLALLLPLISSIKTKRQGMVMAKD